jgi:hypothetical protein
MRLLLQGRRSLTIGQNNLVFYGTTPTINISPSARRIESTPIASSGLMGGDRPRSNQ